MSAAVKGNIVTIEDVTLLERPKKKEKLLSDWNSFTIPSERGKNVEEYMVEMREKDRLHCSIHIFHYL